MKALSILAVAGLIPLAACMDTTTVSSANRHVIVGNFTGVTMTRFYASRTTTNSWEEDILGSSVLASGRSVDINIDDGTGACLFDLKAVFADGDVVIREDFNVCRESNWSVV